jgi:hypothetical protein
MHGNFLNKIIYRYLHNKNAVMKLTISDQYVINIFGSQIPPCQRWHLLCSHLGLHTLLHGHSHTLYGVAVYHDHPHVYIYLARRLTARRRHKDGRLTVEGGIWAPDVVVNDT